MNLVRYEWTGNIVPAGPLVVEPGRNIMAKIEGSYGYPSGRVWLDDRLHLHRKNGPAIETNDGEKRWYLHGVLFESTGMQRLRLVAFGNLS